MISLPPNSHFWIAAGVTDLRRGFTGLSALVQTTLEQNPFTGHAFVFRGRRGDLVKLLWFDGDGLCLLAKRLERGRFVWPRAESGTGDTAGSRPARSRGIESARAGAVRPTALARIRSSAA
jgi:transposase